MEDLSLLALRVVTGGLLAGHGAQKLFGWFGGGGPDGTRRMMAAQGLEPADVWAMAAGGGEFAGGLLTALGLLHPIGPLTALAPMVVATGRAHWGRPIWSSKGGAELPVTNLAVLGALTLLGPGRFSADRLLGSKVPAVLTALYTLGTAGTLAWVLSTPPPDQPAGSTS